MHKFPGSKRKVLVNVSFRNGWIEELISLCLSALLFLYFSVLRLHEVCSSANLFVLGLSAAGRACIMTLLFPQVSNLSNSMRQRNSNLHHLIDR